MSTALQPQSPLDAELAPLAPRTAGLLRRLRAVVAQRVDGRRLELLAADDLSAFRHEDEAELAVRIRSVSGWLGTPYGGLLQKGAKVKLCQVDDEGVIKERIRLTDMGVDAIAKRLGASFTLPTLEADAGWLVYRAHATFADGSTMEIAAKANAADADASQKAQAMAHRLAVYRRVGIPVGKSVGVLDMEFVGRVRDNPQKAKAVAPGVMHPPLPPLPPSSSSSAEDPKPRSATPRPAAEDWPEPSAEAERSAYEAYRQHARVVRLAENAAWDAAWDHHDGPPNLQAAVQPTEYQPLTFQEHRRITSEHRARFLKDRERVESAPAAPVEAAPAPPAVVVEPESAASRRRITVEDVEAAAAEMAGRATPAPPAVVPDPEPAIPVKVGGRAFDAAQQAAWDERNAVAPNATGEVKPTLRVTAATNGMRRDLREHLHENGYDDEMANQQMIQKSLGLPRPCAIAQLDEAHLQVLLEDLEWNFPPKTAPALPEPGPVTPRVAPAQENAIQSSGALEDEEAIATYQRNQQDALEMQL